MDKESKTGLKRKSKPMELSFDSDDDEPIGSLLKLKAKRSSKKIKAVADCGKKKAKEVEKVADGDGEVGMDDTLATFRKKLRGPKKASGSAVAEPFSESLTESPRHSELDPNEISRMQEKGLESAEGEYPDSVAIIESLKMKAKLKNKRFKVSSETKLCRVKSESGDGFGNQKSVNDTLQHEKEVLSESRDEVLQDSLASVFHKVQTGSPDIKQGYSSTPSKANQFWMSSHTMDDSSVKGTSRNADSVSLVQKSPSGLRACSGKTSDVSDRDIDSEDTGCQPGSANDIPNSSIIVDTSYVHCAATKDNPMLPSQDPPVGTLCNEREADPEFCLENKLFNDKSEGTSKPSFETPPNGKLESSMPPCVLEDIRDDVKPDCILESDFSKQKAVPSVSSQEKDDRASKHRSSPGAVCNYFKDEVALGMKHEDDSQSADLLERVLEPSRACPANYSTSGKEEVNGTSYSSIMLNQASSPEDRGSIDDPETKESSLSLRQRFSRNAKKRRHGDMAYEGDADWDVLVQGQEIFVSHRTDKTRQKFISSMGLDTEDGKAAAVSMGLKARAVGPIEKIKFKEVLKRKGGLQEYLECRNHILSVWNKDVGRILLLSDFGVCDACFDGESPQASLIRDVYTFLDQCGYINFGVPALKEKVENQSMHDLNLLKDKHGENIGLPIVDSENGVSSYAEETKSSEMCIRVKNDDVLADGEAAGKLKLEDGHVNLQATESSTPGVLEGCPPDNSLLTNPVDTLPLKEQIDLEFNGSFPSCKDENSMSVTTAPPDSPPVEKSAVPLNLHKSCSSVPPSSMDCAYNQTQSDLGSRKSIIVVGAGPAGLTAARHLQRQGFNVVVLEARSRIGGRVFTDYSSLSVPVDLGASIITGVEADVATERRPDPSSLICAQLGLELTVLNSDCPLYDTVTGQKVPADLDEDLEAEFNTLLDDMELLVAKKGEDALKMSLEEGLEYALRKRRLSYSEPEDMLAVPDKSLHASTNVQDSKKESLSPLERRIMDWHFAHLEYGCAALLKEVSLPNWNQDDVYGGFGGAHCMIRGGYSAVVDSLGEGLCIHLDHVVTDIAYSPRICGTNSDLHNKVKVSTSNGSVFSGDAVLVTVPLGCLKADTIKFSPPLPKWKHSSIKRLGFGVLNKVVLEFPEVFWDDSVDYFGATAEISDERGRCFMFWNVKKTVGAPVLIALVVGKAAVDGQDISNSDQVGHALDVLRKLFGQDRVPDPLASVVTDWGRDPYSYGAYSYVAIGSSGEDYDTLGRPVENCIFFAGEATCKEHPDTVGGAMVSGQREAVRIIDILRNGADYTSEVEAIEAIRRRSDVAKSELKDLVGRLDAAEFSNSAHKDSVDESQVSSWHSMLRDMFFNAKTTAGRLYLAKELLKLPAAVLKEFASSTEGLSTLNSWILDSLGKDGTQLLRHCVRLLVIVSKDLLAVRLSGIGKTIKQKVCVHTSRDIRAIASQLVNVWVEVYLKEKAARGGLKSSRHSGPLDSKSKSSLASEPPMGAHHAVLGSKGTKEASTSAGHRFPSNASTKETMDKSITVDHGRDSHRSTECRNISEENDQIPMSEEEKAAFAAAEAARAAAIAAAKAYASYGVMQNTLPQLPKILSFHKFATREQYDHMDDSDSRKKWSGAAVGRQDCLSEIDSRNCRVRDWSVDFTAAGVNLENSKLSADNHSQRSHSHEVAGQLNFREHSGESVAIDNSILTKAWVDSAGSTGLKDYNAIERWQCQAAAASSGFSHGSMHIRDEEDSNMSSKLHKRKHDAPANESSASQVTTNKEPKGNQARGAERIKQSVVDYVASLLMPLYKARKIDKEGYKSIMKKTATKVMEQATDAEKAMTVSEFLDYKRKNKIRAFVDTLIERHMARKPDAK